jgi:hypothetical protein
MPVSNNRKWTVTTKNVYYTYIHIIYHIYTDLIKFKHLIVMLILLSIFWYSVLPDNGLFQQKHVVTKFLYI